MPTPRHRHIIGLLQMMRPRILNSCGPLDDEPFEGSSLFISFSSWSVFNLKPVLLAPFYMFCKVCYEKNGAGKTKVVFHAYSY